MSRMESPKLTFALALIAVVAALPFFFRRGCEPEFQEPLPGGRPDRVQRARWVEREQERQRSLLRDRR